MSKCGWLAGVARVGAVVASAAVMLVAPAPAGAASLGVATGNELSVCCGTGPEGGSYIEVDSVSLTGAIGAGSTFVGTATIPLIQFAFTGDCLQSGNCPIQPSAASISGSDALGTLSGSCAGPSSGFLRANGELLQLNLGCSISVDGGVAQAMTLDITLLGPLNIGGVLGVPLGAFSGTFTSTS